MRGKDQPSARVETVLTECYEAYRLKLFQYCLARLDGAREDADDCVQDAFLVLQQKLQAGETVEHPRAFLYRTAENFVRRRREQNAKAAQKTMPLEDAEHLAAVDPDYLEAVNNLDYDALAQALLAALAADEQTLYDLRYCQKRSVNEIADRLGLTPAAVSMRILRLKEKVKRLVYEKGGDSDAAHRSGP